MYMHHTCSMWWTSLSRRADGFEHVNQLRIAAAACVGADAHTAGCTCGYTFRESWRPRVQSVCSVCIREGQCQALCSYAWLNNYILYLRSDVWLLPPCGTLVLQFKCAS